MNKYSLLTKGTNASCDRIKAAEATMTTSLRQRVTSYNTQARSTDEQNLVFVPRKKHQKILPLLTWGMEGPRELHKGHRCRHRHGAGEPARATESEGGNTRRCGANVANENGPSL